MGFYISIEAGSILARQGEVRHEAASGRSLSPHHVKVSLTIGTTTSLIKWVALKWPLTQCAHMMLQEASEDNGHKSVKTEEKIIIMKSN